MVSLWNPPSPSEGRSRSFQAQELCCTGGERFKMQVCTSSLEICHRSDPFPPDLCGRSDARRPQFFRSYHEKSRRRAQGLCVSAPQRLAAQFPYELFAQRVAGRPSVQSVQAQSPRHSLHRAGFSSAASSNSVLFVCRYSPCVRGPLNASQRVSRLGIVRAPHHYKGQ